MVATFLQQADVLVNSVANKQMKLEYCGAISNAFHKAVGKELDKEFAELGGLSEGRVVASMVTKPLPCQLLLYASLRDWCGATSKRVGTDLCCNTILPYYHISCTKIRYHTYLSRLW